MDKTKPNHRTIVFFFSQAVVLLLCLYFVKDNVCRFYFQELMKLGRKGNCRAYIYPRCSVGMTQNLHSIRVVFGAITLC